MDSEAYWKIYFANKEAKYKAEYEKKMREYYPYYDPNFNIIVQIAMQD